MSKKHTSQLSNDYPLAWKYFKDNERRTILLQTRRTQNETIENFQQKVVKYKYFSFAEIQLAQWGVPFVSVTKCEQFQTVLTILNVTYS